LKFDGSLQSFLSVIGFRLNRIQQHAIDFTFRASMPVAQAPSFSRIYAFRISGRKNLPARAFNGLKLRNGTKRGCRSPDGFREYLVR
jgi:hypothetical protein